MPVILLLIITFLLSFFDLPDVHPVIDVWFGVADMVGYDMAIKIKDYVTFLTGMIMGALLLLYIWSGIGRRVKRDRRLDDTDIIALKLKKDSKSVIKVKENLNTRQRVFNSTLVVLLLSVLPVTNIVISNNLKSKIAFWIIVLLLLFGVWFGLRSSHIELPEDMYRQHLNR